MRTIATAVAEALAAVLVVAGLAMAYRPAGLIGTGLALGAIAWRLDHAE